jgi:hypothetical protein
MALSKSIVLQDGRLVESEPLIAEPVMELADGETTPEFVYETNANGRVDIVCEAGS